MRHGRNAGCHRSRYSETCALGSFKKAKVCEYADLWHQAAWPWHPMGNEELKLRRELDRSVMQ